MLFLTKNVQKLCNLKNSNMEIIYLNNILILIGGRKGSKEINVFLYNIYLQNTDKIINKRKNTILFIFRFQ